MNRPLGCQPREKTFSETLFRQSEKRASPRVETCVAEFVCRLQQSASGDNLDSYQATTVGTVALFPLARLFQATA
jgi:hypothetical protein